ncbi:MAG: COX15/CtaA family protein [Deltaproteobacteria bacterium]|nr:COX15/CtaA family protein [Deltaproteobacteria bacterium]
MFRSAVLLAFLLAFGVILLGSYVRLSEAGLGCPDWPGCYGRMTVPLSVDDTYSRPLETGKAWKEMIHRYFAATLGLFVLFIAILSWIQKRHRFLATLLLALVIFQALLGMWTVTLLLHPLIVMGHLFGGFATLALLWWFVLGGESKFSLPFWPVMALFILLLQILLGAWTSSNYAAFSCPDFPTCQGKWWPQMDFKEAFNLGVLGRDYQYGVLNTEGRVAIQMMHRIFAVITFFVLLVLGLKAVRRKGMERFFGAGIALLVTGQVALGISNILMFRPLPVAVAHTGVAALLVVFLVGLIYSQQKS